MTQISIAILGFGTVGRGVYQILTGSRGALRGREGLDIEVRRIVECDIDRAASFGLAPRERMTDSFDEVLADSDISVVVECIGGVEPARTYILRALEAGKTVVTSNKEVVSKHWHEFVAAAKQSGAGLYIEATVCGGIPVIRTLIDGMQGNNITHAMGIVNGTTNYILTNMAENSADFAETLREAQKLGYAEANPTADVEGFDAAYKLSILGSLAFRAHLPVSAIYREGITKLTGSDFAAARELGYVIKLLAIGKNDADGIEAHVHPAMLKRSHPLATVSGVFNAAFFTGDAVGDLMLYGRGAGSLPTGSAIVSDIIYACHAQGSHKLPAFTLEADLAKDVRFNPDFTCGGCVRLHLDNSAQAAAEVTDAFAHAGVAVESILQLSDSTETASHVAVLTRPAKESMLQAALASLRLLPCVKAVDSYLRVEA